MAEKITDAELVEELRQFGEVVKVPIDRKKRPILIKKLNHLKARENPPVQSKRVSTSRRKRAKELSDDESQSDKEDNGLVKPGPSRVVRNSKVNQAKSKTRSHTEDEQFLENSYLSNLSNVSSRLRSIQSNEHYDYSDTKGLNSSSYESTSKHNSRTQYSTPTPKSPPARNNHWPILQKKETCRNDEFSDSDLENDSIYEADKSINTTYSIEQGIDDDLKTFSPRTKPTQIAYDFKSPSKKIQKSSEQIPRVSMIILSVMGIFFIMLAVSYMFVTGDKNKVSDELLICGETLESPCFKKEQVACSLTIINLLQKEFADQVVAGNRLESKKAMTKDRFQIFVSNNLKKDDTNFTKDDIVEVILNLVIHNPHWGIISKSGSGYPPQNPADVKELESTVVSIPLLTRITRSVYQIIYGLILLMLCVVAAVFGIYCLRWQTKSREEEQGNVYCMVEKIIDMLKDNYDLHQKERIHPPYLAVQHIRDQLLPPSRRRKLQPVWDKAVKFIEANESRIRLENQTIQGEDFAVWRWLQNFPNGQKVWQGQAFGEHSPESALHYSPTPCLKIRNMFDTNVENDDDDWEVYVEDALLEKCKNTNGIVHIHVDKTSEQGCVYMKCSNCTTAFQVYTALHGWWFDGRLVTVKYLRLEHYHDRFQDAVRSKKPLKPSTNRNLSLSQPYYKSTLEMT